MGFSKVKKQDLQKIPRSNLKNPRSWKKTQGVQTLAADNGTQRTTE